MTCFSFTKKALRSIGLFCLISILATNATQGQEFVDTTPQNRNVVLEEFTGLNCTWCPAGHKIADEIKSQNPESVFLVNIHTGTRYARPTGNQPEFRTGLGSAIANLMNVEAFPSATINRMPYSGNKALRRRSNWKPAANQVLQKSSPVNVAVQTNFNEDNWELEVKVEAYYTGNSSSNTNMLNVALLQNNIPGPQVDGANSYPDNYFSNDQYNHKHMLKDFLTGQWGDTIQHPVKDSLFSKTYTYKIPKDFNKVPVKPQFLEAVAYIAEGKENIYTGASDKVKVDNQHINDLDIVKATEPPEDLCDNTLIPKYTVVNNGSKPVDSFTASIRFEDTKQTKTFHKDLESGASAQIEFDEVRISGGEYELQFNDIYHINGGNLLDAQIQNNFPDGVGSGYAFVEHPFWKKAKASFDDGEIPDHFAFDNSDNPNSGAFYNPREPMGADGSEGALYQYLDASIDSTENSTHLLFGKMNLSEIEDPYVSYYYTFTEGNKDVSEGPKVRLEYSEDCGNSWETIRNDSLKETVDFNPSENDYIPSSDDYRKIYGHLDAYEEKDDIIFRLSIERGDDGHLFWIDEIAVGEKEHVASVKDEELASKIVLYPNPVPNDYTKLKFDFQQERTIKGKILNATGRTVQAIQPQTIASGQSEIKINTASLINGVYIAKLNIDGQMETVEFVVNH